MPGWMVYDPVVGKHVEWRAPTEDIVAGRLAAEQAGRLRYCHDARAWFVWDGALWRRDRTGVARRCARETARALGTEPDGGRAAASGRPGFAAGALRFAGDESALAVTAEDWDADPFLLGTPDGPIDLRSGAPARADPADGISRATAVAPAPPGTEAPAWCRFLDETFGGDAALIGFLQRVLGYALTGSLAEQVIIFGWGAGGIGKTVLVNAVLHVLGDYGAPVELAPLTAEGGRHAPELAALRGVRLVTVAGGASGWSGRRLERLTGGDPIPLGGGRAFAPTFKLLVMGGRPPSLPDGDVATRRRLRVVPFRHRPAVPDRGLAETLRAEAPAILRWMIDGCLAWQADGLGCPRAIEEATAASLEAQDVIGAFLAERCDCATDASVGAGDLWRAWCGFTEDAGEPAGSQRQLAEALVARGIRRERTNTTRFYRGLGLRDAVTGDSGDR